MTNLRDKGILGETTASDYLIHNRYRIIHRNFHMGRFGEFDIIAEEIRGFWPFIRKTLVFIEVKTTFCSVDKVVEIPESRVNFAKRRKLLDLVRLYLLTNKLAADIPHRIDVIGVVADCFTGNILDFRHHINAVHY